MKVENLQQIHNLAERTVIHEARMYAGDKPIPEGTIEFNILGYWGSEGANGGRVLLESFNHGHRYDLSLDEYRHGVCGLLHFGEPIIIENSNLIE
jgi:hypothetical protein